MEELHELDLFLDDDALSSVTSGSHSGFFTSFDQNLPGGPPPRYPSTSAAPPPPPPKEKKNSSCKGRGGKKTVGKEATSGGAGPSNAGWVNGGEGNGGVAEGTKGGSKKRQQPGDGAGAPSSKKAKTTGGSQKGGNAGLKQPPVPQAFAKGTKEKKPPKGSKDGASTGTAKVKMKAKGKGKNAAAAMAVPTPVVRRAPSDMPAPSFFPYAELPTQFSKQHRNQPSFLRTLRDFHNNPNKFMGQHKELLMQDLRRAAEVVTSQKMFLETQLALLDNWSSQAWPPMPSHVPSLSDMASSSEPGLPPGLAFDPSQADDWFLLDDDSMDNLFKDDEGGMDFLEDIAAMVGSDHGPPGLSQGQDMLAEKPPPSPRPPIPSPRTPSDLIKVRIICESIGLGRGADNKVGYARLIPPPQMSQGAFPRGSPIPQAPPQVQLLPMVPPLASLGAVVEAVTKGKGKTGKGNQKEATPGATPSRKKGGPGRPPKSQSSPGAAGQAGDKSGNKAAAEKAPVTDRLDRYCDLEVSSERLWDYLQEGMFLMPITDVITAQSNVAAAERMVSERLPLEPVLYVDRESISKDVEDEEFDDILDKVTERPSSRPGPRKEWDPATDIVPESLEMSYNQNLRPNPVLRRLLTAFVTPLNPVVPTSPAREELPKGRTRGNKTTSPAARKKQKSSPVDEDSMACSGEFELDWVDNDGCKPPTTSTVKEEAPPPSTGLNGGNRSVSHQDGSAPIISLTSNFTLNQNHKPGTGPLLKPMDSPRADKGLPQTPRRAAAPTLDDRLCTELEFLGIFEPFDRPRVRRMRTQPEPKDLLDAELAMSIRQDERELNRLVRQSNERVTQLRSRVLEAYKAEVQDNTARPSTDDEIVDRYLLYKKEHKHHKTTPSKAKGDRQTNR